jgi:hypothetical protein
MKISLKPAVTLATAIAFSQLGVQIGCAADIPAASAKAPAHQAAPVVIARKVSFTPLDLAKYQRLEAASRSLRKAGSDDAQSWVIIGVAAVLVTGVIAYTNLYRGAAAGGGGGGY